VPPASGGSSASDNKAPTFEQPPSDAGESLESIDEYESDQTGVAADATAESDDGVPAVEQTDGSAFDADALEEFGGLDEIDEVEEIEEDNFGESLETDVDRQAPPAQPEGAQADIGAGESAAEDADDIFHEIDDQFTDDLFDSLVMEESGDDEDVNLGEDDTAGDLAEVDFYIQQGLYDEAEEALEEFEADNPGHEGIDKRKYQIKTARQGALVRDNPTGASSLSKKFQADVDAEDQRPDDLERPDRSNGPDQPDAMNTNIEVGEAYRDMGMYNEAIEEFREAADDPEVAPHARYRIALCEAERGNSNQAADELQSLLSESSLPDDIRSAAKSKLDELDAPPAE
jgi:tetratricopeptide (TPR) repeat protein